MPKQSFGSTNDGNTARKFFKESGKTAAVTKLDENLIKHFRLLLAALSTKSEVDPDKFEKHAAATKALLTELHPNVSLTPTAHKLLDHGADVLRYHEAPMGVLNEDAQEAQHKDCRRFRLSNARKDSREHTICDMFVMLQVSSDPVVCGHRKPEDDREPHLEPDFDRLLISHPAETCRAPCAAQGSESEANRTEDGDASDDDDDGSLQAT